MYQADEERMCVGGREVPRIPSSSCWLWGDMALLMPPPMRLIPGTMEDRLVFGGASGKSCSGSSR